MSLQTAGRHSELLTEGHSAGAPVVSLRGSRQPELEGHASLERQGSFDDPLGDSGNSLDSWRDPSSSSIPVDIEIGETLTTTKKKKDRKMPFRVFRRKPKEDKKTSSVSGRLSDVHDKMTMLSPETSLRPSTSNHSLRSMGSDASYDAHQSDQDFTDTLMNPSLVSRLDGGRRGSSWEDPEGSGGSIECSLGQQASLDQLDGEGGGIHYLVHVTLKTGHSLAVRDRTGTSDPYVKFKCGEYRYRSNVIHRNLDPEWNETFDFQTSDLKRPLRVKVYDHDRGSLDDYMGGACLYLGLYTDGELHAIDLGLEDPNAKEEYLGYLRIFLQVVPQKRDSQPASMSSLEIRKLRSRRSTQLWRSVLTVTLLEGNNLLPMDDNGLSDPYCKFKLGRQKYKSKVIPKTLNPNWKERFEMRMYDNESNTLHVEVWDRDFTQSDDFIGHCFVVLDSLQPETTHNLTLPLKHPKGEEAAGSINLLICVSGTSFLKEELDSLHAKGTNEIDMKRVSQKYGLMKSLDVSALKRRDVGFLRVKIERAEQLPGLSGGTSNAFAILEVGNSAVRTKTVYRSVDPEWEKCFYFNVRDVHNELEVMVHNEVPGKSGKIQFIGKVKIPLLRLVNGVSRSYVLKDNHCLHRAKGVVHLKCDFVYNPLRAAVRTINPREDKVLEEDEKFDRKVMLKHIKRVVAMGKVVLPAIAAYNRLFTWENKLESAVVFFIFIMMCLFGELWMFLLLGACVFLFQLAVIKIRGKNHWETKHLTGTRDRRDGSDSDELSSFSDLEDELTNNAGEQTSKSSLRAKLRQFQEILLYVQIYSGYVADLGERAQNLFDWNVPFLCWLAVTFLLCGSFILYFIPIRYVVLAWGVNKFTKRLRNPDYIRNVEILDYLSRAPTDKQLMEWRELSRHRSVSGRKASKAKAH